jgi:hypothetical protein
MTNAMAWLLLALGVGHFVYACVTFKQPLLDAVSSGFVGQFGSPDLRRTAFWFAIFSPLLMLAGHVAIHAVATGDLVLLRLVGVYALVTALIGLAAFPKSPFLVAVPVSAALLAASYGLI